MTTERILDKISYIQRNSKHSRKVRLEIEIVEGEIEKIDNFDKRDSLMEKLTLACCSGH